MSRRSTPGVSKSGDKPADETPEAERPASINFEISESVRAEVERVIGSNAPGEKRAELAAHLTRFVQFHSGHLPPPEIVAQYEQLCPGTLDRLLRLTELAQNARIEERRDDHALSVEVFKERARAQRFALAAFALVVFCTGFVAWLGLAVLAGTVFTAGAIGGAAVFLRRDTAKGSSSSRKRRSPTPAKPVGEKN